MGSSRTYVIKSKESNTAGSSSRRSPAETTIFTVEDAMPLRPVKLNITGAMLGDEIDCQLS